MNGNTSNYDLGFFTKISDPARCSATILVPHLLRWFRPDSVLDVGCGDGTWLGVWAAAGVSDLVGVDGEWIRQVSTKVAQEIILVRDLAQPFDLGRKFDLAISLEVGEHLTASAAEDLVDTLVRHGSVVVFSAAIPGQGGVDHVNEQWPDYWEALFAARGFQAFDCVRPAVWGEAGVAFYYAQNTLVFAPIGVDPFVERPSESWRAMPARRLVHPQLLVQVRQETDGLRVWPDFNAVTLGGLVRALPGAAKREFLGRLGSSLSSKRKTGR